MSPYNEGLGVISVFGDIAAGQPSMMVMVIKKGVSGFVGGANVQVTMHGRTSSVVLAESPPLSPVLGDGYDWLFFCAMGAAAPGFPPNCNPLLFNVEVGDTIRMKLL